jgi:hypothetical protein
MENQRKGFPFPSGKECEADAHKLCPGILKRCVGHFGCTIQCLTDHAPKLSPQCQQAHPCYPDIDKFCAHMPPGENRMMKYVIQRFVVAYYVLYIVLYSPSPFFFFFFFFFLVMFLTAA